MPIMEISETFGHRMQVLMSQLPFAGNAETSAVAAALHRSGPRAIKLEWIAGQMQDVAEERSALRKRYEDLRAEFEKEIADLVKALD
jgi:hypothetical protein